MATFFKAFLLPIALNGALLLATPIAGAQTAAAPSGGNISDPQAVTLMSQMVAALGGPRFLAVRNVYQEGRTSGFYQGTPTGAIGDFRMLRTMPVSRTDGGLQRTEFSKKRDVVNILLADTDWEITYKGKRQVPPQEFLSTFRRRDHSLDEAVRVWWHEPGTVLFYGGQKTEERHLIDEITLMDRNNDNITLQLDVDSHLPVRVSFTWRDPLYKDKDEDAEDFADYHPIGGLPTALNLTFFHNGDMTSQRYLSYVAYNVTPRPDAFDVDATAAKLKR